MNIEKISKKQNHWEFRLIDEDHTMANLIKEISWKFKGEAGYKVEHPLIGKPIVSLVSEDPKAVLTKVSDEMVKLSKKAEKAFS